MSPKVIGDLYHANMRSVDCSEMAHLTRGTPEMAKYCYTGTNTPRKGFVQIPVSEYSELKSRSSSRERIESWLRTVEAPIGVYPPPCREEPHPVFQAKVNIGKPRQEQWCLPKTAPLADPSPPGVRLYPLELPSTEAFPMMSNKPPKVNRTRSFEMDRNPTTPPTWGDQYDHLADAYLKWKSERDNDDPTAADKAPEPDSKDAADLNFGYTTIQVIGKSWFLPEYGIKVPVIMQAIRKDPPNAILLSRGLLSNAQYSPQWAASVFLLEEFHAHRMENRNFAIEKYLRPLCEKIGREYNTSLYNRFRVAYAAYVGILRTIQRRPKADQGIGEINRLLGAS